MPGKTIRIISDRERGSSPVRINGIGRDLPHNREIAVTDDVLEDDGKPDPRFAATPADLKRQGIEDYQLHYALQTISRLGRSAAATPAPARRTGTR